MKKILILLVVLLLLTACADASPTANSVVSPVATTSQPAATTQTVTTLSSAGSAAPPTRASSISALPDGPTSTPAPATVAPPTSAPTIVPATTAPAPAQASLKAVGTANCCLNFSFAGSNRLTFYDKQNGRAGTYTLDVKSGQTAFLTDGFGTFSPDLSLAALSDRQSGQTRLQNLMQNQTLGTLSNAGSPTLISPDKQQVAWLVRAAQQDGPEEPQYLSVWVAGIDGKGARSVWSGRELANLAWLPDNAHLLLTGRDQANQRFGLWNIGTDGAARLIVESKGLTVAAASGDGQWIAYWITLQGPDRSGVWLAHADGSGARRMAWEGSFRWDTGHNLFYLPQRQPAERASTLFRYDPATDATTQLTDPANLLLQVALDQWEIAADGSAMVFRRATDNALWLVSF